MIELQDGHGLAQSVITLAERGILGFAWLDDRLVTRWRFGSLAAWIPLGEPICAATAPFFALEPELLALQDETRPSLAIPRISVNAVDADAEKVSIEVFWQAQRETYLVVLSRLASQSEVEYELFKQVRARRLAEENYRQAKDQIVEKQHLIDLLIDHAPAAIAMFDRERRYVFATKRWLEEFGLKFEPVIGRKGDELPPFSDGGHAGAFKTCLLGIPAATGIEAVKCRNGRTEWVRFDHRPWRRADGSIGGVIAFSEILTDLVDAQRRLEHQNYELGRINQGLDEFASIIAHDLRAPLRAIGSALNEMMAAVTPAENRDFAAAAERLKSHAARMEKMLNDLLEYSRLDIKICQATNVDLQNLIDGIILSLPDAGRFNICLQGSPTSIRAPLAPLDIILRNLLDNAIKHHDCDEGSIVITITDRETAWALSVADDGPGIDPALHGVIFKPFQRGASTKGKPGSGIGLAIIKKTAEALNGSISVNSNPAAERGTVFTLTWPKWDDP